MPAGESSSNRGSAAIVVATAAVTLAIGVTVAALGGYLGPRAEAPPQPAQEMPVPAITQPAAAEEPVLTEYRPARHADRDGEEEAGEHHGRRHHHEREHEEDDD